MNYEEIVEARQNENPMGVPMPIGTLSRRKEDGQWVQEIQLEPQLTDNPLFCEALLKDQQATALISNDRQLPFAVENDSAGPYALRLPKGNYTTLEQYLSDNPSALARQGYISDTLQRLADLSAVAARQSLFLLTMHPSMLLVHRKDGRVAGLLHGSCYAGYKEVSAHLFASVADSVAPEVMEGACPDAAADTYALAWLARWLYESASTPLGAKRVIAKALDPKPERRPATPQELMKRMGRRNSAARQGITLVAAVLVAAVVFGLYFELVPRTEKIEFVKPAAVDTMAYLLEDTIMVPEYIPDGKHDSTATLLTPQERAMMQRYEQKAEAIFRKRYAKEAERVLSGIYNSKMMASDQEKFAAASLACAAELDKLQKEMAAEVGITDVRGQKLASEVIDQVTKRKMDAMKGRSNNANPNPDRTTADTLKPAQ